MAKRRDGVSLLQKSLYEPNFEQIIKKTKGIHRIDSIIALKNLPVNLIFWRESLAQQKNKPRKWIMSDDDLLNYACGKK